MHISKSKLAIAMHKAGISTIKELSDKSGLADVSISASYYRNIRISTAQKLADALNVEISDIITED